MPDRWFRLPQTGSGTAEDPYRPLGADGLDWAGNTVANSPEYVARVYGTTAELDTLAATSGVTEIRPSNAADALRSAAHIPDDLGSNNITQRFRVG